MSLIVKIADTTEELEQVYQLNYQTFVEEIPQHNSNDDKKLIDKFDSINKYFIVKDQNEVIGMMAINTKRPFSLDYKIENLDSYLPQYTKLAEVRLLSIKPNKRHSKVFLLLLQTIYEYGLKNNIDMAVISGTVRQLKLYHHFGFIDFAHLVGNENALFQPMFISFKSLEKYIQQFNFQHT